MSQESYSDFSIIKNYIELKNKYDDEIKVFREKIKSQEEKFKKHIKQPHRKNNDILFS